MFYVFLENGVCGLVPPVQFVTWLVGLNLHHRMYFDNGHNRHSIERYSWDLI